jgi:hypothetical protein
MAKASLLRETAKTPSLVNPLDSQFDSKRIKLNEFVNPLYEAVGGKIFHQMRACWASNSHAEWFAD